jgi:hypothetical protein
MALIDHPNVFRFEGKLWVSELPREEALARLTTQRAWDARNARLQRWWVAIVVGAIVGVAGTLALGTLGGLAPAVYLVLLPVGFGIGAVVGALVNKRFFAAEPHHPSMPERPTLEVYRVPTRVAARLSEGATARQIIEAALGR